MMRRFVIIVAGGKGLRMGGDLPKQFVPVESKPVLMHTLEAFCRWDSSAVPVLVLPKEHQDYWCMLCKEIGCKAAHHIVDGGETRFHSVRNGLAYIEKSLDEKEYGRALIAVHDGVRPFVSAEVIESCFNLAEEKGTAVPVVPVVDSLRETSGEGSRPVDRSRFHAVQTPQVFRGDLLIRAYRQPYQPLFTDDASVVEVAGETICLTPGNRENIKITTPLDLMTAKALATLLPQSV
ncbi:putative 2-C-methyl-D-erythritol 4-phosphate cytidylyltransferase 2 [Bacteroidales bacterium Barb6]|nr:putative 2-C-methyl-D-erythritol 4-phosphate cytidylyltransferase 2 [Bacteroidales bacterium Barb6]